MTMASSIRFEKWEGIGNDFVLLDADDHPALLHLTDAQVRAVCDRHRGIGADGILLVRRNAEGVPQMIVRNADGSRPEMCGNGLRCVAAALARKSEAASLELIVATDAGDKRCAIHRIDDGLYEVAVDMGHARLGAPLEVQVHGVTHRFDTVDVGNPHAITFEPYSEEDFAQVAPKVERAPAGGTNVELCRVSGSGGRPRIEVVVWERGVGWTLACGTGACAVAAAACERGRASFGAPVDVVLPGGPLEITVDASRALRMKGPARCAFRGEVTIA
jgi:diaminopimelate epimerase